MYNEEQKERYLKEDPSARNIFEKTEYYEMVKKRDLYDFSVSEILEFYGMMFTSSLDRLQQINITLKRYGRWALSNVMIEDGQNHFEEITIGMLNTCLDKKGCKLITRKQLLNITAQMQNALDIYTFMALFEGIKGPEFIEITSLTKKDIDTKHHKAKLCTGRVVDVSQELIDIAFECIDTDVYHIYAPSGKAVQEDRPMIGEIWKVPQKKNVKDTPHSRGVQCYRLIARVVNNLGLPQGYFSAKHLWDSGVLNYAKTLSFSQKIPIKEVFYECFDQLNQQYGFSKQMRSKYLTKYQEYLE